MIYIAQIDKTSDGLQHYDYASEVSSHHMSRKFLNSLAPGPQSDASPRPETKHISETGTQDGAIPFWLEDGIPHIRVAVGTPPQLADLSVDTGSGFT